MLLSDRMQAVAALVSPCKSMADIGCDHGYVAIELIRSRTCEKVIAMDINKAPLERAKGNISDYGMQEYIETGQQRLCQTRRMVLSVPVWADVL